VTTLASLPPLQPKIAPALPGEGVWTTDGLPAAAPGAPSPVVKTFIRPDQARPFAVVTVLQFDIAHADLHMVAGVDQPGGPLGLHGTGIIPVVLLHGDALLAAFNGAFKYADGAYGMMADGVTYVPPRWGSATIAVTSAHHVIMGAWGLDKRLTGANHGLVAWRQNGPLLVDHGALNPRSEDGTSWGISIMNGAYTWRSAIGVTAHGTLVYVSGPSLSATTLGQALLSVGATMAMQLDINPYWVRAFTYQPGANGLLYSTRLDPAMQGAGTEYFYGASRDFFYLTRR